MRHELSGISIFHHCLQLSTSGCLDTCGAFLDRSTTIESTTTSLHAVPSEPTTVASRAPAGELTTVPIAAQDADPARGELQSQGHA